MTEENNIEISSAHCAGTSLPNLCTKIHIAVKNIVLAKIPVKKRPQNEIEEDGASVKVPFLSKRL